MADGKADGSIIIRTKIDNSEVKEGVEQAASEIKKAVKKPEKMQIKVDTGEVEKDAQRIEESAHRASRAVASIGESVNEGAVESRFDRIKSSAIRGAQAIGQLVKAAVTLKPREVSANTGEDISAYAELGKLIESDTQKLRRLETAQEEFIAGGGKDNSVAYQRRQAKIEELKASIENAKREQQEMFSDISQSSAVSNQGIVSLNQELQQLQARLSALKSSGISLGFTDYDNTVSRISEIQGELRNYQSSLTQTEERQGRFSRVFGKIGGVFGKVGGAIGKVGGVIGKMPGLIKKGASALSNFKKGIDNNGKSMKKGVMTILKYTLGIRSMYILFNKLRGAVKEGFTNLAQYSGTTNKSLSMLKSALTQIKNSLATAFAPILDVVAPVLTKFINLISQAATYVGMFIASITGQKTFTKAVAVQEDYAASFDKTASGANKAKKALKTYLSGLDEVRTYTEDSDDGGSGGSGGAGGGGVSPSDMFETVEIPGAVENWADKFKEAWANADFTEIGTIVGTKLKNALDSIPWDTIKSAAEKVAKSTATFINGFFATPGLFDSIGRTIGEGINTALVFANTFLETVDWDAVGNSIAKGLNSAVNTISWTDVGRYWRNKFNALVDIIYSFADTFNFSNFGEKVGTAVSMSIYGFQWSKSGEGLGKFATGLFDALDSFLKQTDFKNLGKGVTTAISGFFKEFKWSSWSSTISHWWSGLLDAMSGLIQGVNWRELPTYIVDSIVKFITGFDYKTALKSFGTLVASALKAGLDLVKGIGDLGANLIEGILNGGVDFLKGIPKWIKDNIFGPFVDGFKSVFGIHSPASNKEIVSLGDNIMKGVLNGITGALGSIGTWVKENVFGPIQGALGKAGDFVVGVGAKIVTGAKDLWNGVKSGWNKLGDTVVGVKDKLVNGAKNLWDNFSENWKDQNPSSVVTDTLKNGAKTLWDGFKDTWDGAKEGAISIGNTLANTAGTLWENFKTGNEGWTKKDRNVSIANALSSTAGKLWENFKTGNEGWTKKDRNVSIANALSNGAGELWKDFKKGKDGWNKKSGTVSIKNKLEKSANSLASSFRKDFKGLAESKRTLSFTGSIDKLYVKKQTLNEAKQKAATGGDHATGGIYKNGHWQKIEGYAGGGSPSSAQVFMARENGMAEMVGRIGRATAVMNNDQIVASVAAGVYRAVVSAFGRLQTYFSSMAISMGQIPESIERLNMAIPQINVAPPVMASGTVLPTMLTVDIEGMDDLRQSIDSLRMAIQSQQAQRISPVGQDSRGATYQVSANVNRRTLFDVIIEEGKLRQTQSGRNPFMSF